MAPAIRAVVLPALACAALAAGCLTSEEQREDADREVYAILDQRRAELLENPEQFTVDPPEDSLRQRILRGEPVSTQDLGLLECLEISAENNRDYQTQRENLYLVALALTFERWNFSVQTEGEFGAAYRRFIGGTEEVRADGTLTLSKLLGSGAFIVGDIGLDLFKSLGSGNPWNVISNASLSITQPLMRGYGRKIVEEPLTQAERDVVYAVRDYERFRRTFAVTVASQLYRVLQSVNEIDNERANVDNLSKLVERNEAWEQAGRISDVDVDQARQQELSSSNRLVVLEQNYLSTIDDFNFFLGLPVEIRTSIDPDELVALEEALSIQIEITQEDAVQVALEQRLDYQTAVDRVADAKRKVHIAADALRAALDVGADINLISVTDEPLNIDGDAVTGGVNLDLELPLNRLPERNTYRTSLITLQRAVRSQEALADSIAADVRADLRDVKATRETYYFQQDAVALAERRVVSASLRQSAGRATTRDVLESQAALLEAQNVATAALISHRLAQLQLILDMEALRVDERGIALERSLLETRNTP
jgi:outer membrane protein TolC